MTQTHQLARTDPLRLYCSEVWGGIRDIDRDVCTTGVTASLYARSASGSRGGDVYYFGVCDNDLLTHVAVADVVGHGETVSRVSCWLYELLSMNMNEPEGDRILDDLNRRANEYGQGAMSTAIVMSYQHRERRLSFATAGHPPALVRRGATAGWEPMVVPSRRRRANLPLGVLGDTRYDQGELQLESGDQILLYTDGLIEAPDSTDHLFETERLLAALERGGDPTRLKHRILGALLEHTGGAMPPDDVTLMAIEIR